MPNEPVDPVRTTPPTQATVPAIADLSWLNAKVRSIIYMVTVMLAAAYAVVEANVNVHWGVQAAYAGWNALVAALAVSNVPRSTT